MRRDEFEEDLEKEFQNLEDELQDTKEDIESWWSKFKTKFNEQLDKRRNLILVAIIVAIAGIYINPTLPVSVEEVQIKSIDIADIKTIEQEKEVPEVKAGVFYTIDLSKMYTDKNKATENDFAVYYRNKEKNATMWFTLEEPIKKLNYNKKAYDKYLEEQALLEDKEVK